MNKTKRLTVILSGLLIGMGLRSLAQVLREEKRGRERAIIISLLIGLFLTALTGLLWAFNLI